MYFTKMQGCGNDYLLVDAVRQKIPKEGRKGMAVKLSDRHFGVGADGLIFIQGGEKAPYEMEMYNADGSRGEMCGNGIRCVGKYLRDHGMASGRLMRIESMGKVYELESLKAASEGSEKNKISKEDFFRVEMGAPVFLSGEETEIAGYQWTTVSIGNPHAVVLLSDHDPWKVEIIGPLVENAPCFPDRINAEFVRVRSESMIEMRVWERGSKETLSCGTGACAAAAVCMQKGLTDEKITVKLIGGELAVFWDRRRNRMYLTGPACTVFEGEI